VREVSTIGITSHSWCMISLAQFLQPSNDRCANSITLDASQYSVIHNNYAATVEGSSLTCQGVSSTTPGNWYRVVGNGQQLKATTCSFFTDFDTQLSVFQGPCNSLRCVGAQANMNRRETCAIVEWQSTVGTEYHILVQGEGNDPVGFYELIVDGLNPVSSTSD